MTLSLLTLQNYLNMEALFYFHSIIGCTSERTRRLLKQYKKSPIYLTLAIQLYFETKSVSIIYIFMYFDNKC